MGIFKKIIGSKNKKETEEELNDLEENEEIENGEFSEKEILDNENEEDWMEEEYEEGQLSIDVYQDKKNIYVKSTIAGVKPEDLDISINNDMLTIRGKRHEKEEVKAEDFLYKECYWGTFSRSIILPTEVQANKIEALLENGVLTVIIPKAQNKKPITVKVKEQ